MKCNYSYEDITVGNRNSINEFKTDLQVREVLWKPLIGDYVLDIGAGFGAYTLTALEKAVGFVFAFERDSNIAASLRRNLQNNPDLMGMEKATVCRWNLDDSLRTVDIYLDELSFHSNRIDWIKIDMGTVPDTRLVLWGCKDTIRRFKPTILMADPEPPSLSFLEKYRVENKVLGHSLLTIR